MKWIKAIVGLVVVLVIAVVGFSFMLPSSASLSRSITIAAPPEVVFERLNSFEHFNKWSPWAGLDPETRYFYEGPTSGVGAIYRWESDQQQVGSGRQEIVESEPHRLIAVRLAFSGFTADNLSHYRLSPIEGGTEVVWAYQTEVGNQIIGRYFLLMLDRMLGPQYEQGLQQLKSLLETEAATLPEVAEPEPEDGT